MSNKILGFLALSLSAASMANAQSETLLYTGQYLTDFSTVGPVAVSGNISGYLTLDALLAPNLSDAVVTPITFSFNGAMPLSGDFAASGALLSDVFQFTTDSTGAITGWGFTLSGTDGSNTVYETSVAYSDGSGSDFVSLYSPTTDPTCCSSAGSVNAPGTWTTVTAPEIDPASAAGGITLLLGGVAVLRGRRRVVSLARSERR